MTVLFLSSGLITSKWIPTQRFLLQSQLCPAAPTLDLWYNVLAREAQSAKHGSFPSQRTTKASWDGEFYPGQKGCLWQIQKLNLNVFCLMLQPLTSSVSSAPTEAMCFWALPEIPCLATVKQGKGFASPWSRFPFIKVASHSFMQWRLLQSKASHCWQRALSGSSSHLVETKRLAVEVFGKGKKKKKLSPPLSQMRNPEMDYGFLLR